MLKALINHFIHFSKFLLFWYCSDVVMMSSFIFCSLTIDTFLCNLPYRKTRPKAFAPSPGANNNKLIQVKKAFFVSHSYVRCTVNWIPFWCGMESNLLYTASKVYPIRWTKLYMDLGNEDASLIFNILTILT